METVVADKTGVFFEQQTVVSLIKAIKKFESTQFNKEEIREHAMKFDEEIFKEKIERFINQSYQQFKAQKYWKVI